MKAQRKLWGTPLLIAAVGALALPGAAQAGLLSSATASLTGAKSGSITLGDLVKVSSSEADASGSSWDAAAIGGQTIIGKEATTGGEQDQWTGLLGDLGSTIDDVNAATCEPGKDYCVLLLDGSAFAQDSGSSAGGNLATAVVTTDSGSSGALVANSGAGFSDIGTCTASSSGASVLLYVIDPQGGAEEVDPSSAHANDCGF